MLRDMFGDVRMLCHDTGLMNPIAKLIWRICKIDGKPSAATAASRSASTWSPPPRRPVSMPHVITQSCCSDGSCVYACPVNCIHPSPDEPGFATAEMLYIDPVACVDCGACVSACPVGAIAPDTRLDAEQLPFIELNASFYPERPRREAAADVEAGAGDPGAGGSPRVGRPADGGDRRVRARGDVRRRRTAHPARRAGQRLRKAANARTGWCAPGSPPTTRAPSGSRSCSTGSPRRRGFRFYLNVEVGNAPEP